MPFAIKIVTVGVFVLLLAGCPGREPPVEEECENSEEEAQCTHQGESWSGPPICRCLLNGELPEDPEEKLPSDGSGDGGGRF